jgi:2-enoate reductase
MELDNRLKPANKKYRILVVGGGPGGMISAITAKKQGHEVELWEKSDRLGGNLSAAGAPPFKSNTKSYLEYLEKQIQKNGVTVRLHKEASAENVAGFNPDAVILASGAKPIIPPIPGLDGENVVEATALLSKNLAAGNRVVILGGGLVGCETAIMLDKQGKDVTIVEILDSLLKTAQNSPNNAAWLRDTIAASKIKPLINTKLVEVKNDRLIVESGGNKKEIPYDTLVVAAGFKSNQNLAGQLGDVVEKVFTIGDYKRPGKVFDAVHEGYNTIRLLDDLMETI